MKIKEKMGGGIRWVKERPLAQKMVTSHLMGQLRRLGASCERNPFPAQMILVILYRLSLDALYLTVISPLFAYADFTTDLRPMGYALSLLALAVFVPFIAKLNQGDSASAFLITIMNYLYFIPLTSYFGCKGADLRFFVVALIYWAILLTLQHHVPTLHFALPRGNISQKGIGTLTLLASGFVLYISGRYTGFRITLNVLDVYGIRDEAGGYGLPAFVSYALSMMTVLLPLLLVYWLQKKRYGIAAALVVVYLLFFSISAQKSQLFFLFLILGCYFFYRPWMLRWAAGLLTALSGFALLEYKVLGSFYVMTLFFRRMMYVPVQLGEAYGNFFSENPLNLFRDGIMGKFSFETIYSTTIPHVMGEFFGEPLTSNNNGLLGDLFANLPVVLGLLLLPMILILCFRLLDAVSHRLPPKILLALCVLFANNFMNTSWSTVLLTGGFLLSCLLLYFFPREEKDLQ